MPLSPQYSVVNYILSNKMHNQTPSIKTLDKRTEPKLRKTQYIHGFLSIECNIRRLGFGMNAKRA